MTPAGRCPRWGGCPAQWQHDFGAWHCASPAAPRFSTEEEEEGGGGAFIGSVSCVCVCVCDAQFFQIMLKLRGSTMMRPNHEFCCFVALSPGFRNWVEMTRNMQ